jgi:hypothetical protein
MFQDSKCRRVVTEFVHELDRGINITSLRTAANPQSHEKKWRVFTTERKEAYVGYVSALDKERVSHMDFKCDLEKDKLCQLRVDFELQAGASLRRIGLYGDPSVVRATAEYIRKVGRLGAGPCDANTWKLDLGMYLEMRRSALGDLGVSDRDLAELLLPCKIP